MIDQINRVDGVESPSRPSAPAPAQGAAAFGDLLAQKLEQARPLQFSGHAAARIRERNIAVDEARLGAGVDRAAAKGARTTLVLVDQAAFVVAAQNRTVITAVERDHLREQVFTNIDSAVIA